MAVAAGAFPAGGAADIVGRLVASEGSAVHAHVRALAAPGADSADIADAVHFITLLHGRYPGVVDNAADRAFHPAAREWMFRAAAGFAAERAFLTRLVVAAGPMPSTLGQAQSESAVIGQTHALSVLSQSERRGTALGAAFALALDWTTVRGLVNGAAQRFGIAPPPADLPRAIDTERAVIELTGERALERAVAFGAQQLLLQHRGLWDLLAARASVRAG